MFALFIMVSLIIQNLTQQRKESIVSSEKALTVAQNQELEKMRGIWRAKGFVKEGWHLARRDGTIRLWRGRWAYFNAAGEREKSFPLLWSLLTRII